MTGEELEFAISQYLDGDLPVAERAALEARLATDAEARALLEKYRGLQTVLKQPVEAAPIRWDALAAHLADAVASATPATVPASHGVSSGVTDDDALDQQLAAYTEDTLTGDERAALEIRLAVDTDAAVLLSQYRSLDAALAAVKSTDPLPAVRWDALAEHLADAVSGAGAKPIFSFKWARAAGRIAVAACVLLAAGLGINRFRHSQQEQIAEIPSHPAAVTPPASMALVSGPELERAAGKAVVEIEIGGPAVAAVTPGGGDPAPLTADAGNATQFADVILSRPSRVVIANGDNAAQDSAQMPY